jgi:hypothetical protein
MDFKTMLGWAARRIDRREGRGGLSPDRDVTSFFFIGGFSFDVAKTAVVALHHAGLIALINR